MGGARLKHDSTRPGARTVRVGREVGCGAGCGAGRREVGSGVKPAANQNSVISRHLPCGRPRFGDQPNFDLTTSSLRTTKIHVLHKIST